MYIKHYIQVKCKIKNKNYREQQFSACLVFSKHITKPGKHYNHKKILPMCIHYSFTYLLDFYTFLVFTHYYSYSHFQKNEITIQQSKRRKLHILILHTYLILQLYLNPIIFISSLPSLMYLAQILD